MASSKDSDFVAVPQALFGLRKTHQVFFRFEISKYGNPFDNFISKIAETTNTPNNCGVTGKTVKAIMLFHNYFGEVGTVTIEIFHVYLDFAGCRIDFEKSKWMEQFHGCPNFWAGFGMAIAPVQDNCPEFGAEDPDGAKFMELVKIFGKTPEFTNCPTCSDVRNSCVVRHFIPPNGSVGQPLFVCPACGQCWWQYNHFYHLWEPIDEAAFTVVSKEDEEVLSFINMQ